MASGDASRVGFPEVVEPLRSRWRPGITFDEIIELRDDLDAMLQRIRSDRRVKPAVCGCPQCGHVGKGADLHVTVRAMILSLRRFGIATAEQTHALERAWAAKRKDGGLDLYGRQVNSPKAKVAICSHQLTR